MALGLEYFSVGMSKLEYPTLQTLQKMYDCMNPMLGPLQGPLYLRAPKV